MMNCRLRCDKRAGSRKLRFAESVRYQLWDPRPIGLVHGQPASSRGGMDSLTHLPSGGEMQVETGALALPRDERECELEAALK